jgi:hypothetical protein
MSTELRTFAVFPEPRQIGRTIAQCHRVLTMMADNPRFPAPTPPLARLASRLAALENDEQVARRGGKGTTQQRDVSLALLRTDVRLLKAYIQHVADKLPPDEAAAAIESAGMRAKRRGGWRKPPVGARRGAVPGQVVLDARAVRGPAVYRWQRSTDQETWTDLPESLGSALTVSGLRSAAVHYFRLRTLSRADLSDWSPVLSVVVH